MRQEKPKSLNDLRLKSQDLERPYDTKLCKLQSVYSYIYKKRMTPSIFKSGSMLRKTSKGYITKRY